MSTTTARRLATSIALWNLAGCAGPTLIEYSTDTPAQVLSPINAPAVMDGRARFRAIFCPLLPASGELPDTAPVCEDYLTRLSDEPARPATPGPTPTHDTRLRILVLPGLFGDCVSDLAVPFGHAAGHLEGLGYHVSPLMVSGRSSSGLNADMVARAVAEADLETGERLVLIAHSKGAVDAMEFLNGRPDLAHRVAALVSVAGAVNGSPLADALAGHMTAWLPAFDRYCDPSDIGALESLRRSTRLRWLATHPLPPNVRYYSVVAFSDRENMDHALRLPYDLLATIDPRNDGAVLFTDQVIPGATLLGYANADHLDVVLPEIEDVPWYIGLFFEKPAHYPRTALLEAIMLYVSEDLGDRAGPGAHR